MKETNLNGRGGSDFGGRADSGAEDKSFSEAVPYGAAEALRAAIEKGRPVAALTGAGVSAESGIPTFRGAEGLWKGFRAEELATPEAFRRNPDKVWAWYTWRRGLVLDASPNAAHHSLAALERICVGRGGSRPGEFTLITQNVDGLHQRAGSRRVVELHGNIHHARCLQCGHVAPLPDGPETTNQVLLCTRCDARTRPHIVWFGEMLPEQPWREAYAAAAAAAVLLVIGTSAAVYPAAGLVDVTLTGGGVVIEINPEETEMSHRATWVIRQPAGIAMPALLRATGIAD